jgi:hypothetical protein
LVELTIFTSHSMTGTSISTPTMVASAAPEDSDETPISGVNYSQD